MNLPKKLNLFTLTDKFLPLSLIKIFSMSFKHL
jgi:hypothetical protein